MATVYLMAAGPNPSNVYGEEYWTNAYAVLEKAFRHSSQCHHALVTEASHADILLVCGMNRNPMFPVNLLKHPTIWANRDRAVWLSLNDAAFPMLRGIYVSLTKRHEDSQYYAGGIYPHVAETKPLEALPMDISFQYLFSFVGDFTTHEVRRRIGTIRHPRGLILDTSSDLGGLCGHNTDNYRRFKQRHADSLLWSKFILCPRGGSPSSIRLFETMKASRVPVVISDDWVKPPQVPWDNFCVYVPEKKVLDIPEILATVEHEFPNKALAARKAWERYFSFENLANTVVDWSLMLLDKKEKNKIEIYGVPLTTYLRSLADWDFWRRGVATEAKHWCKTRLKRFA